jgi:DNA-binding NarL/FixJ family response regulator
VRVCALVSDLMDRSKISAAIPGVVFSLDASAGVVIVDLARGPQLVAEIRAETPGIRIVCYGPHVDDDAAAAARAAGADVVLPRSRFFRDPAAAIADAES